MTGVPSASRTASSTPVEAALDAPASPAIDNDPGRLIALDDLGGHAGKVGSGRDGNEIDVRRQVGAERRQPRRGGTHPAKAERDLDLLASRAHVGRGKTDREGRELRVLRVQGDFDHGERLDEARDQTSQPATPGSRGVGARRRRHREPHRNLSRPVVAHPLRKAGVVHVARGNASGNGKRQTRPGPEQGGRLR